MTKSLSVKIEQPLNTSLKEVWHIITNLYELRNWYFYLDDFKPDIGFSFQFVGGSDGKEYVHLCTITNMVDEKLWSHTFRIKGLNAETEVTFALSRNKNKTVITLTHTGLENFSSYGKGFQLEDFQKGWEHIVCENLKNYIENR